MPVRCSRFLARSDGITSRLGSLPSENMTDGRMPSLPVTQSPSLLVPSLQSSGLRGREFLTKEWGGGWRLIEPSFERLGFLLFPFFEHDLFF